MIIIAICVTALCACWSKTQVFGEQMHYVYPVIEQPASGMSSSSSSVLPEYTQMNKRFSKAEPSCEELRIMWKYSKRQSRAIENTNEIPMFRDPFLYNVWDAFPGKSSTSAPLLETRDRNGNSGTAPIYGRVMHKEPEERTLRNGMPSRVRNSKDQNRFYGTISRKPPDSRKYPNNLRMGNGVSLINMQLPQAGSFQQLKDLIRSERARPVQRTDQYGKVLMLY